MCKTKPLPTQVAKKRGFKVNVTPVRTRQEIHFQRAVPTLAPVGCSVLMLMALSVHAYPAAGTQAVRTAQVRDSAGIEIVLSEQPLLEGSGSWRIAPSPRLRIGTVDGSDAETFHRVTHAARLSDGGIVVLNNGTKEVRYYASTGSHERTVGRSGAGPGDFRTFSGLQVTAGDSVLVFDALNNRVSIFDAMGELSRIATFRLPDAGGAARIMGRAGTGSFLASVTRAASWDESNTGEIVHEISTVIRYDAGGHIETTLGDFEHTEMAVYDRGAGPRALPPPFWRRRLMVLRGDDIITGHTRSFELHEISSEGVVRRILRTNIAALPISSEDREPYVGQAARSPDLEEVIRLFGFPETHPAFNRILVDKSGNLWVELHVRAGDDARWSVFDHRGHWFTDVRVPSSFQPMEIGDDYVLGVWRDDLDVEHIDVRDLVKSGSGR
jgi:hypothetical protein